LQVGLLYDEEKHGIKNSRRRSDKVTLQATDYQAMKSGEEKVCSW
jgi:hypothetical protein